MTIMLATAENLLKPVFATESWRETIERDLAELRDAGALAGTFLDPDPDNEVLSPKSLKPGFWGCMYCGGPLGRRRRSYCSAECRRSYQRRNRITETEDYGYAVARMVRAYGRRVAGGNLEAVAPLARMMAEAHAAMQTAVAGLRAKGISWSEIGRELGVSKQAARQRWGGAR